MHLRYADRRNGEKNRKRQEQEQEQMMNGRQQQQQHQQQQQQQWLRDAILKATKMVASQKYGMFNQLSQEPK